jgi:pyruvate-ferredoxin/flavodoxin oxidoreductase
VVHARTTGEALLGASSVQEAHDFAAVAHAATLRSRVPFLHLFDGFRTSHEVDKITVLDGRRHSLAGRGRGCSHPPGLGLTPQAPVLRVSAQNSDVFHQAREAVNPYYEAVSGIVDDVFGELEARCVRATGWSTMSGAGRRPRHRADGLGGGCAEEAVEGLVERGERVGLLKIRLFRPFAVAELVSALTPSVPSIAVLDRTKEPGGDG